MITRPPSSTRTDTLFPYTTRFRSIQIYDQVDRPDLKYPAFVPRQLPDVDAIFERVATGDVLLHHPFDAFTPVLELIRQAADDPSVLAIKQTLYRSEEHTSELQSLMRNSSAVFCLKKKKDRH